MKHITQTITGDKVIARCQKCSWHKEISTKKPRRDVDIELKTFEKDHAHPGKSK